MENLVLELQRIQKEYGEDAYREAVLDYARQGIRTGGRSKIFWKTYMEGNARETYGKSFEDLEEEVASEAKDSSKDGQGAGILNQLLGQQMPGLKTQGQMSAFMASLEALRVLANAIFEGNPAHALKAREALYTSIDLMTKATEISKKLGEVPEAATSKQAAEFKNPPSTRETEEAVQQRLLTELAAITSEEELNTWYVATAGERAKVRDPKLRNGLMDPIRAKKVSYQ